MTDQQTAAQDARIAELEAQLEAVGAGGVTLVRNDDSKDAARWRAWVHAAVTSDAAFMAAFSEAAGDFKMRTGADFVRCMDAAMAATEGTE